MMKKACMNKKDRSVLGWENSVMIKRLTFSNVKRNEFNKNFSKTTMRIQNVTLF